jgi:hypothetical protein
MKSLKNILKLALGIAFSCLMVSCEKSAGEEDYGYEKIYIPQSLLAGSNLNYLVPAGLDSASRNYKLDKAQNKYNIILGISKSGKSVSSSFTVDLKARPDTVTTLIANNTITNGVILPESVYSVPSKIEVTEGSTAATFYLSVKAAELKANYAGKKAVVALEIFNPSNYMLNQKNNKVVVIIDVNALPQP